jgi:hypothetical protein
MTTLLTYKDALALLVWLFELPPSKIKVDNSIVTVASTEIALHVYNYCTTTRPYRFSAPKVIHSPVGILLRQEYTYTPNLKGYKMLRQISDYPIYGVWNSSKCGLDFDRRIGYKNYTEIAPTNYDIADIDWFSEFNATR